MLVAAWITSTAPSAWASGEPEKSFLYQNFTRARDILDRAVAAHGGPELLDRSANIRMKVQGSYVYEAHFARPWTKRTWTFEGPLLYSADLKALRTEYTFVESLKTTPSFLLVGPSNGMQMDAGSKKPDSVATADLERLTNDELEVLPQEYLRQARDAAASLRVLDGATGYDVLTYTLDKDESRALYFDAKSHLLMRVERIGHWKHKGDRLEWRTFDGYVSRNGIQVPRRSESHVEESAAQHNIVSAIASIDVGVPVKADELTIPAAYREGLESWALAKPAVEDPDAPLPYRDLGNGAYIIDCPSSDSRLLLVEFTDHSVIVEAGDTSELGRRILATARTILPGKPVRYVAMTHHHPLYANGLRPYAYEGVTILATPGNVDYYRDLTTRPYRIHPDQQQRTPRAPKIESFDKVRILEDKKQRLELHPFSYSSHTDEYVLPYLPSHKLIVTGDMVYILRDDKARPANVRELAIHRAVTENKLDVESILQTWFLEKSDPLVPYAALEAHVQTPKPQTANK